MAYKIQLSYKIVEVPGNTTVAPDPLVPNASYSGSFDTAEQAKQFILSNAAARVTATAGPATQAQGVLDQIDDIL